MKRVLWIEDRTDRIESDRSILEENGNRLYLAYNLGGADYRIEKQPGLDKIDAIISDLNMPDYTFDTRYEEYRKRFKDKTGLDLSGLVWLKQFHERHRDYPANKIIVVSAYLYDDVLQEINKELGDVRTVSKNDPALFDKLLRYLDEA